MRPAQLPIGLQLNQVARSVGRAFDEALTQAGGSLPVWLVLLAMKSRPDGSQRDLAEVVGVREATLTHHLNSMEASGLITRRRDPANRRVHVVELTASGEHMFARLRTAAGEFDTTLRAGFDDADVSALSSLLTRLASNVGAAKQEPPWAQLGHG
jgi:MarR family transcriptional regulator, transcriptional regulator for hemolysin